MVAQVHPDCINASNPYHECTDYCFKKISERKSVPAAQLTEKEVLAELPKEFGRKQQLKKRRDDLDGLPTDVPEHESDEEGVPGPPPNVFARPVDDFRGFKKSSDKVDDKHAGQAAGSGDDRRPGGVEVDSEGSGGEERRKQQVRDAPSYENMSEREKKLFDLRMKMNQARKANQTAVVAEKKREHKAEEEPSESRGVSKAKWYEEKQKKMGKVLEANGLDMARAYMLDTQEAAEGKYKKWEKKEAAFGWDVFNSKSLYKAYKKRAANVPVDMDEYERQKESDPDFYRDSSCLEYGKAPNIPEENVDRMVAELQERGTKRKDFSRRRRHHEEKDIDSINERNEHFNRKIERAFGKYTVEIKNNLERGTALPD